MAERKLGIHWPVLVLGIVVAAVFVIVLFVFEVKETEYAVVKRFGRPRQETVDGQSRVRVYRPGLHAKVPFVDTVWRHDRRWHCYELRRGQVEQMQTADHYQVILTTFVLWRVGDPYTFLRAIATTDDAEKNLDELVRHSRNNVIGRYSLPEMINVEAGNIRIPEIEADMLAGVSDIALREYGIEVKHIGIKHLGFPQEVTAKVFERMQAERRRLAEKYRAEGLRDAQKIRAEADLKVQNLLNDARGEATRIRGEGDSKAAEYYQVFKDNPELAAFLRRLDALRNTLSDKTTLIIDTNTPPYDLLLPGAVDFQNLAQPKATSPAQQGSGK